MNNLDGGVSNTAKTFNKKLLLSVVGVSLAVFIKLILVAGETDNWRGFAWSALHVALVAVGSYLALRKNKLSETLFRDSL